MKIGVLAMQGAYAEHISILRNLEVDTVEIRNKEDLKEKIESELPVWGTCAGMILLARSIYEDDTKHVATMDIEVKRNAYGR